MQPKKIKILLVEDDPFLISLYTSKFNNEGFEVIQTARGEDAKDLAIEQKPQVILLDLLLPGVDGFSVLKTLKSRAETKDIPVVILTNLGEDEHIKTAFSLGASDYLIKANFLPQEVLEKVKERINKTESIF